MDINEYMLLCYNHDDDDDGGGGSAMPSEPNRFETGPASPFCALYDWRRLCTRLRLTLTGSSSAACGGADADDAASDDTEAPADVGAGGIAAAAS